MEAFVGEILEFLKQYSIAHLIIALIIINFVGILKLCKLFNKVNSNYRKTVFYIVDIALSFGVVALYNVIYNLGFNGYITFALQELSCVVGIYALYENARVRNLWQWVLDKVANIFKNNPQEKIQAIANKIKTLTEKQNKLEEKAKVVEEKKVSTNNNNNN